jgi:hypothetical protein
MLRDIEIVNGPPLTPQPGFAQCFPNSTNSIPAKGPLNFPSNAMFFIIQNAFFTQPFLFYLPLRVLALGMEEPPRCRRDRAVRLLLADDEEDPAGSVLAGRFSGCITVAEERTPVPASLKGALKLGSRELRWDMELLPLRPLPLLVRALLVPDGDVAGRERLAVAVEGALPADSLQLLALLLAVARLPTTSVSRCFLAAQVDMAWALVSRREGASAVGSSVPTISNGKFAASESLAVHHAPVATLGSAEAPVTGGR